MTEVISSLPLYLSGGDQMMPQGIIRDSLGDASRHHQGVKMFNTAGEKATLNVIMLSISYCINISVRHIEWSYNAVLLYKYISPSY